MITVEELRRRNDKLEEELTASREVGMLYAHTKTYNSHAYATLTLPRPDLKMQEEETLQKELTAVTVKAQKLRSDLHTCQDVRVHMHTPKHMLHVRIHRDITHTHTRART